MSALIIVMLMPLLMVSSTRTPRSNGNRIRRVSTSSPDTGYWSTLTTTERSPKRTCTLPKISSKISTTQRLRPTGSSVWPTAPPEYATSRPPANPTTTQSLGCAKMERMLRSWMNTQPGKQSSTLWLSACTTLTPMATSTETNLSQRSPSRLNGLQSMNSSARLMTTEILKSLSLS